MKKTLSKEHGQSLVLVTLLLVGMVAMMGLIFDGGNAYLQRRRMQNAADAATLAGGRELALALSANDTSSAAESRVGNAIRNYFQANGGNLSNNLQMTFVNPQGQPTGIIGASNGIPPNTSGVSVTTATNFPTFFLTVLNIDTGRVAARALAQTGQPTGMTNLFPLAVPTGTLTTNTPPPAGQCNFNYPAPCQVWGTSKGDDEASRGWTNFKVCGGGSDYLKDVLDGNATSGTVKVGESICTETGSIDALSDHLRPWIGKDVIIPIYDCTNEDRNCPNYEDQHHGTNLKYHVAAFAVFTFKGFYFSNNNRGGATDCNPITNKYLCGQFKRWATTATDIDVTKPCVYGLCGFQMWQ